jgi:hypothetical protein
MPVDSSTQYCVLLLYQVYYIMTYIDIVTCLAGNTSNHLQILNFMLALLVRSLDGIYN